MPQQVMHKASGEIATVLCHHEDLYWLKDPKDDKRPWTSPKSLWGPIEPKTGDVWETNDEFQYRVVGVDEVNKTYLLVVLSNYANGKWLVPEDGKQQTSGSVNGSVYVRRYPDNLLKFVSRVQ